MTEKDGGSPFASTGTLLIYYTLCVILAIEAHCHDRRLEKLEAFHVEDQP